jgi:hypothetical protein
MIPTLIGSFSRCCCCGLGKMVAQDARDTVSTILVA